MQKSNRHHGQAVKTPPFHGGITSSNLVGVICRWTLWNELKSIPTKISTGITGGSGFLASKGYMTWRYVINTDTGMKEARKFVTVTKRGWGEVRFLKANGSTPHVNG